MTYKIICDKAFIPYLKKLNCVKIDGDGIETTDPLLCQHLVNRLWEGYKLLFGTDYKSMIQKNQYFTV